MYKICDGLTNHLSHGADHSIMFQMKENLISALQKPKNRESYSSPRHSETFQYVTVKCSILYYPNLGTDIEEHPIDFH
jgi:hypothetical protein